VKMSISSVNNTSSALLLSLYANSGTKSSKSSDSSAQSSTASLLGVAASNSDGDTFQISDEAKESMLSASEMFSKMDTDGDGALSESEFTAARPSDVTEEMAANLYSSFDSDSSGSLTSSEFTTAMNNMPPPPPISSSSSSSESDVSTLFDALDTNGDGSVSKAELAAALSSTDTSGSGSTSSSSSDSSKSFDALDTNKDGVVSADELAAARPDDVTEEMAANLFKNLDQDGSGGLTKSEYTAALGGSAGVAGV
jgi:Ca2+-binding EF-hand superfamily protein